MLAHEYYEELCALLTIGQLSAEEYQELVEHLKGCPSCRHATDDFSVILDEMPLGETDVDDKTLIALQGDSYRARFFQRAVAEGVPFSQAVMRPRFSISRWSWPRIRLMPGLVTASVAAIVILASLNVMLSRKAASLKEQAQVASATPSLLPEEIRNNQLVSQLEARVADFTEEESRQQGVIAKLQTRLNESRAESFLEKRKLASASTELAQLQEQAGQTQATLDAAKAELLRARSEKDNLDAALAEQQFKITELAAAVKEKEAMAERERQLTLVAKDVRELMGARNLHILDVSDVDGNGRAKKSFGRVFLVEGKSLIFYAFDLGDHENPTKVSFQAWGQLEGRDTIAKDLGVFYVDDHTQKRWVLKVTDPKKLSAINSVFVTVEPLGGAPQPNGKKLLYAYLGTRANHP